MNHIDYGLGVFDRRAFADVPAGVPHDLADVFQQLLKRDDLAAYEVKERFYEIGSFAGIKDLEAYLS
jgi:NDP-sugar pyrophosphorylase family protein